MLSLGSYLAFLVAPSLAISFIWGFGFSLLTMGVFYMLLERLVFRRTYALPVNGFLVSLGIAQVIEDALQWLFQHHRTRAKLPFPGVLHVKNLYLPYDSFLVIGGTLVVLVALTVYLERTRAGLAIRAIANDGEQAGLMGVPVAKYVAGVFFIGGMLAGAGGSFVSLLGPSSPTSGSSFLLQGLLCALVGGLGSVRGALIGAFVVATFEAVVIWTLVWIQLASWIDVIEFGFAIILLMFRPQGIVGGVTTPLASREGANRRRFESAEHRQPAAPAGEVFSDLTGVSS